MIAAVLDRHETPMVEGFDFNDSIPQPGWMPVSDRHRRLQASHATDTIRFQPTPVAPDVVSVRPDQVDEVIGAISRHYGHDPDQISKVIFTLRREVEGKKRRSTFRITVERDRDSGRFTAETNVLNAVGHGETIGEAFSSCLQESFDRVAFLLAHKDELGSGLREETDRLVRWSTAFH